MARTTIVFGLLLILLGLVGYFGESAGADDSATSNSQATMDVGEPIPSAADHTRKRSVTSLIPACVGALLFLCGLLALNEKLRMHVMHVAVLVGLLGAIAGIGRGGMGLGKFIASDPELNRRAFVFVWLMAILCTVFVVLCVRSFIAARNRRKLDEGAAGQ